MVGCCLVTKLCLTACDPMDCSPPGFSAHGTLLKKKKKIYIYIYMCVCVCVCVCACACMLSHLSGVQLFASPWTVAHQATLSMEFPRQEEWVAMPSSRGSSVPRDRTHISCIAGRYFTAEPLGKPRVSSIYSPLISTTCSIGCWKPTTGSLGMLNVNITLK